MNAFFSGTDDKYELGDPGIHLVVGSIKVEARTYEIAASVVGSGRRFIVSYKDLIEAEPVEGITFHPDVLSYVDYSSPVSKVTTYTGGKIAKYNYSYSQGTGDTAGYQRWLKQYSGYSYANNDYNDPFYYNGEYYDGSSYQEYEDAKKCDVKLWQIEDVIRGYIEVNSDDINVLFALMESLKDDLKEVEQRLDSLLYDVDV